MTETQASTVRDKFLFLDFETTARSTTGNAASPFDPVNVAVMLGMQKVSGQEFMSMGDNYGIQREMLVFSGEKAYSYSNLEIGYKEQHWLERRDFLADIAKDRDFHLVRWTSETITKYLEDVHTIVAHSATFDILWLLRAFKLDPRVLKHIRIWCTQLGAYLLSAQTKIQPSLDSLVDIKKEGPGYMWEAGYDTYEIPFHVLADYLMMDVNSLRGLYKKQLTSAISTDRVQFFKDQMEALLAHALITRNGMLINKTVLGRWLAEIKLEEGDQEAAWSRHYEHLLNTAAPLGTGPLSKPVKIDVGSRSVLSRILFDSYILGSKTVTKQLKNGTTKETTEEVKVEIVNSKLKAIAATVVVKLSLVRDGNGVYTVSDEVLQEYDTQIRNKGLHTGAVVWEAGAVLEMIRATRRYRAANKLRSTYLEPMLSNTIPQSEDYGELHPNFNFCVTSTGRLSSSKPNLQNQIDHAFKAAVEAPGDYYLVQMDYKQLEVIVLALLSGDAGLINLLTQGIDIHTALFEEVHGRPPSKEERKAFKACSFGLIYGSSANGLVKTTGLSLPAVNEFIRAWKNKFPKSEDYAIAIAANSEKEYEQTPQPGGVPIRTHYYCTPVGRMLAFKQYPNPHKPHQPSYSWPQMKNYPIQSLASDIVKGMVTKLMRRCLIQPELVGVSAINTVHDNVIMYVPEQNFDQVVEEIRNILESVQDWLTQRGIKHYGLPFKVDVEYGKNWYDLNPYQPKED